MLIARLTGQLRCYLPEPVDETWGRLRHLGARREQLIAEAVAQIQQIRALLECVWPASLDTARQPFRSQTCVAAVTVVAVSGWPGSNALRREISRRGGRSRRCASCVHCSPPSTIRPG